MARPKTKAKNESRPFEIHELFFSTTDRAGVIRSGNEVFRRVAGFDSVEELIGKPHNIIRHPDMPRAVFDLLWKHLLADQPIAAYVKNLATDGCYYWVVALAIPIADGFLSVRFKPSTPLFKQVQDIYRELREIELPAEGTPGLRQEAMERAGARLVEILAEKGFRSYDDFMRIMLATEMSSREREVAAREKTASKGGEPGLRKSLDTCLELDSNLDAMFGRVESFLNLITKLEASSAFLQSLSEQIHLLSMNSLISSHHMAESGHGLTVVADGLASISGASTSVIEVMTGDIHELVSALRELAFRISGAKLQVGMAIAFLAELLDGTSEESTRAREEKDLTVLIRSFAQLSSELLAVVPSLRSPLQRVFVSLDQIGSAVRSLSRIHLIGRVEAAHCAEAERFLQLFEEVEQQLQSARTELQAFGQSVKTLVDGLPGLEVGCRALGDRLQVLNLRAA